MTGWFDILSLDKIKMKEDEAGLRDALRYFAAVLAGQSNALQLANHGTHTACIP